MTFHDTAVGDPDAPSPEEDPPPGPVSIFNEAIGRPSTVQRLAPALRADIDARRGGVVRLALRLAEDGTAMAELSVDLETGIVRLDYTGGPILPLGRPAVLQGMTPPSGRIEIDPVVDGAAIFGSLNGRPLAFLAFADAEGVDRLHLSAEGGRAHGPAVRPGAGVTHRLGTARRSA